MSSRESQPDAPTAFDLTDPDLFVEDRHHAVFDWMRRESPVYWHPHGDDGFWVVSRHSDLIAMSRDSESFTIEEGFLIEDLADTPLSLMVGGDMITFVSDPPEHTRQRALVNDRFKPRAIAPLEPWIRAEVEKQLDAAAQSDEADFVEVIGDLPSRVIATLMGVPEEDQARMLGWLESLTGRLDDEDDPDPEARAQGAASMFGYAGELAEKRRSNPGEDVISDLVRQESAGSPLSGMALGVFFMLVITAGSETTRSVASLGQLLLLQHSDERRKLLDDPGLLPNAIEEMVRIASPVNYFRRTARRDVELGGRQIAKGERVTKWFCSANRDERVFRDPHTFRVDRDPNPHVGFGTGAHFCLGAHLARLELRVIFEELLRRFPAMERAGEPVRLRSNHIHSLRHLPVRLAGSG